MLHTDHNVHSAMRVCALRPFPYAKEKLTCADAKSRARHKQSLRSRQKHHDKNMLCDDCGKLCMYNIRTMMISAALHTTVITQSTTYFPCGYTSAKRHKIHTRINGIAPSVLRVQTAVHSRCQWYTFPIWVQLHYSWTYPRIMAWKTRATLHEYSSRYDCEPLFGAVWTLKLAVSVLSSTQNVVFVYLHEHI